MAEAGVVGGTFDSSSLASQRPLRELTPPTSVRPSHAELSRHTPIKAIVGIKKEDGHVRSLYTYLHM